MFLTGKQLSGLLPLLLFSALALSQEIEPYSRFALGQAHNSVFSAQKGIGGLAAAYRDPLYINFLNPASYTGLALTTLEAGVNFTTQNIKDGQTEKSYRASDGFFDYLAFGFPAGKRAGISFGLIPYSIMNYNFEQTKVYDIGSSKKSYEGDGTIYQMYFGGGYRFPKIDTTNNSFSIGMNFVYLFGNLNRRDLLQFSPQDYYNTRISSTAHMSNTALNIGLQYKRSFNKKLYGVIGAYGYFPVAVNSTEEEVWTRYVISSNSVYTDTVFDESINASKFKIPVEVGAGITIGEKNFWSLGAEFRYTLWSDLESFSTDAKMEDSWEVRAGGEIRPNSASSNAVKRTAYRLGGFYDSGYLNIGGTRIIEYGVTFGLGVPVKTSFARLNFSFDVGSRGTTVNGLIKETFFRGYIGFTFNDKWFLKPKFD